MPCSHSSLVEPDHHTQWREGDRERERKRHILMTMAKRKQETKVSRWWWQCFPFLSLSLEGRKEGRKAMNERQKWKLGRVKRSKGLIHQESRLITSSPLFQDKLPNREGRPSTRSTFTNTRTCIWIVSDKRVGIHRNHETRQVLYVTRIFGCHRHMSLERGRKWNRGREIDSQERYKESKWRERK